MIKIDNALLESIGLGSLPDQEKNSLLRHIYETLEMRVGIRLADQMTDDQLSEFERYFDAKDDAGAFNWLQTNFPNYKEIVQEEFDKLKIEVQSSAPQILSASQAAAVNPGMTQPVEGGGNFSPISPATPMAMPPQAPPQPAAMPPQPQAISQPYPGVAPSPSITPQPSSTAASQFAPAGSTPQGVPTQYPTVAAPQPPVQQPYPTNMPQVSPQPAMPPQNPVVFPQQQTATNSIEQPSVQNAPEPPYPINQPPAGPGS